MPFKISKKSLRIQVSKSIGDVSALFYLPENAKHLLLFAHGAGEGMENKFMEQASNSLAEHGVARLRFNFL